MHAMGRADGGRSVSGRSTTFLGCGSGRWTSSSPNVSGSGITWCGCIGRRRWSWTMSRTGCCCCGVTGTEDQQPPGREQRLALGRPALTCKEAPGAGDENRTRTISLGSAAVTAARGVDQASLAVPSDPGCPLITLANGPLMAQRSLAARSWTGRSGPSPAAISALTVRGRQLLALAANLNRRYRACSAT